MLDFSGGGRAVFLKVSCFEILRTGRSLTEYNKKANYLLLFWK
jgi:hypothetical protein